MVFTNESNDKDDINNNEDIQKEIIKITENKIWEVGIFHSINIFLSNS